VSICLGPRATCRVLRACALAVALSACGRGSQAEREALSARQVPVPAANGRETGCFTAPGADSAEFTYSDVRRSPETYDETGAQITLVRMNATWTGHVRFAEGQLGEPLQMRALEFDPAAGALQFQVPRLSDTLRFSGTATCALIAGLWQPYSTTPGVNRSFPRLP
jgi:hypothetical protein